MGFDPERVWTIFDHVLYSLMDHDGARIFLWYGSEHIFIFDLFSLMPLDTIPITPLDNATWETAETTIQSYLNGLPNV
jgi:hypothetical protein